MRMRVPLDAPDIDKGLEDPDGPAASRRTASSAT